MTPSEQESRRARRFGWTSLCVWASFGLALEAANGFKLGPYLDDELARMLLRLGHAHGVGLALVVLAYAAVPGPRVSAREDGGRAIGRLLRVGALSVPLGFALSAVAHPEGDPSLAILLVPVGALCTLFALGWLALAAWRERATSS